MDELEELKQQYRELMWEKQGLKEMDDESGNYWMNMDRLIEIDQELRDIRQQIRELS